MTKLFKKSRGAKKRPHALHVPTLKHTWTHTLALYPSDKSRKPIFSITAKNGKSISVLKLALILLGVIFAAVLVAALIKRIREKLRAKRHGTGHCCCDACPGEQTEE